MTEAALLSVRDLSVAFRQGERELLAVDRISFELKKGETVALVGEVRVRQVGDCPFRAQALALSRGPPPLGVDPFQGPGTSESAGG